MSAMQVRKDVWERTNPMLAQSRHQQMLMNVTPGTMGRFVSSKLLTSYFCSPPRPHGSLCLRALFCNTPHSQTYTMAQILYKRHLDFKFGLEMLAFAFSFTLHSFSQFSWLNFHWCSLFFTIIFPTLVAVKWLK